MAEPDTASTNEGEQRCQDVSSFVSCNTTESLMGPVCKGSGGYADVYIGKLDGGQGKTDIAIKVLRVTNNEQNIKDVKTKLFREMTVWEHLKHKNILPFFGLAKDYGRHGCPALISLWCSNGTITDFISAHPETDRLQMMSPIADGLHYLHQENVLHGDLKPSNILISDAGCPLLCDFGHSRFITLRGFTTKPTGTIRYRAPELMEAEEDKRSKSSDIYAFAMTCYEIHTGLLPFHDLRDAGVIFQVLHHEMRPLRPQSLREELWDLLERCWVSEPEERMNIDEVRRCLRDIGRLTQ